MWRYRGFPIRPPRILRSNLCQPLTRAKHGQNSSVLSGHSYLAEQTSSEVPTHWFLNRASFDHSCPPNVSGQAIRELKSFDDFGLLSPRSAASDPTQALTSERTFMDQLLSYETSSSINFAAIPTTADPSELGGSTESGDVEHLEELLDQGYDVSAVLQDMASEERRSDLLSFAPVPSIAEHRASCESVAANFRSGTRQMISERQRQHLRSAASLAAAPVSAPSPVVHESPSPSDVQSPLRFDPDAQRSYAASAEEVVRAVHNQDLPFLRSLLMEKKWPEHRSIGRHLDQLFELVIRDSFDTDEAIVFLQDFAASNRRGFLHDINGVRLATRVARDSGSVRAAMETLRVFRNMFLVRSPVTAKSSTPAWVVEDFYSTLCSIGSTEQVEEAHRLMVDRGFDSNSNGFTRACTRSMLKRTDFPSVFGEWRRLSTQYGTTCGSELVWEGLFTAIDDRKEQARIAGDILAHCRQYDHPFAMIANLLMVLVRIKQLDAAKVVFTKVSVPGRFFKKPLQDMTCDEGSLELVENFAHLVTSCMFAEKRRSAQAKTKKGEVPSSFLSPELLHVLDSFYGVGRPKQLKAAQKNEKRKLHRVSDEQLFELSEFLQGLWLEKAEKANDAQAAERMICWSTANKLEIAPKLTKRIAELKSRTAA